MYVLSLWMHPDLQREMKPLWARTCSRGWPSMTRLPDTPRWFCSHREQARSHRVDCPKKLDTHPTLGGSPEARLVCGRGVHPANGKGLDMNSAIRERSQRSAGSLSCTPLQAIDNCAAAIGNGGSSARNAHPSTSAHAA